MKKLLIISIMCVFSALLFVPTGFSYNIDGYVYDWGVDLNASGADLKGYLDTNLPSGGNDIDIITEDNADKDGSGYQYVEPGYSIGNTYDAEAMYFDDDDTYGYIAIITGAPRTGVQYLPGDIAIDVRDGGEYGYEYGIGLNGVLYGVSDWNDVTYYHNADPWTINIGDDIGTPGTVELAYNYVDNDHYVIETKFKLSDLGLVDGDTFNIHWTMQCGNDVLNLEADISSVPEADTMLLLGFGLISLVGIGRTRFRLRGKRDR